ncbi:40S small subunit processome assembly factor 1-like [Tubulanus polymorphus]|uniref:40S small subunit processome assembly factor 1-like n=1 Tax=Tubulanus polymorphus TaxID=672921 RepID=UPI003DA4D998
MIGIMNMSLVNENDVKGRNNSKFDGVQDKILQRLTNYADAFLDDQTTDCTNKLNKKLMKKKFKVSEKRKNITCGSESKKKRRKIKKKLVELADGEKVEKTKSQITGQERHLSELKKILESDKFSSVIDTKPTDHSTTTKRNKLKKPDTNLVGSVPEVFVFEDRKLRKPCQVDEKLPVQPQTNLVVDDARFDLKRARLEVQKFGISGFDQVKKEIAKEQFLVKLGAKPTKRPYVNYRVYQEMVKKNKEYDAEKQEMDRKLGLKVKKSHPDTEKSKNRDELGLLDGQIGRYKDGIQFLSKDDIEKVKKSKNKKR